MEFAYHENKPWVRIGVLQSEKSMDFTASVPFEALDNKGNLVFTGEPQKKYTVRVIQSQPVLINPMIRLAITTDYDETQNLVRKWEEKKFDVDVIRVGENIQVADQKYVDNREYWLLAVGFTSIEEAEERRRQLPDFGSYSVVLIPQQPANGTIAINNQEIINGIRLVPKQEVQPTFILHNVRVGIGFHWDHREAQSLENILEFQIDKQGLLTAVNVLDLERYLASVNSSEMAAECSFEFLKAQTILARSTVFATAGKHHYGDPFDLCADDHCQCFHGCGAIQARSNQAAQETSGQVLLHNNHVCDARYAKICGGISEEYQNVWDNRHIPYLRSVFDGAGKNQSCQTVDTEEKIRSFVNASPDVFCNPGKHRIPEYLDYSHQYFRWKVDYLPEELGEIVAKKSGKDLGAIRDIVPLKRGISGRLIYIELVGEGGKIIVGKELEIRRVLSQTHLYSSCFFVEKKINRKGVTKKFTLHGAGWGHGVGMCQVGAAIMAETGYSNEQILSHYYPNSGLKQIY